MNLVVSSAEYFVFGVTENYKRDIFNRPQSQNSEPTVSPTCYSVSDFECSIIGKYQLSPIDRPVYSNTKGFLA